MEQQVGEGAAHVGSTTVDVKDIKVVWTVDEGEELHLGREEEGQINTGLFNRLFNGLFFSVSFFFFGGGGGLSFPLPCGKKKHR